MMDLVLGETKVQRKHRLEQQRLQDLESRRRCCNCESADGVTRIEFEIRASLEELFQKPMKGYICKICVDVAKSSDISFDIDDGLGPMASLDRRNSGPLRNAFQKDETTCKDVNIKGEWTCNNCRQSNCPFAKVCDKCSTRRDDSSKGDLFPLTLGGVDDELGLCLEIFNGSIRIVDVISGSLADKSEIPKGVLTMIEGESVNSSAALKTIATAAKKNGKKSITLRIVPQTLKPSELVRKKSKVVTPPAVPIAPRTPPTGWTLPVTAPPQQNLFNKPTAAAATTAQSKNAVFPNPTQPAQQPSGGGGGGGGGSLFPTPAQQPPVAPSNNNSLFPTPTPAQQGTGATSSSNNLFAPPQAASNAGASNNNDLFPTPTPALQSTGGNALFQNPAPTPAQPAAQQQNLFGQQQQQQQQQGDLFAPDKSAPTNDLPDFLQDAITQPTKVHSDPFGQPQQQQMFAQPQQQQMFGQQQQQPQQQMFGQQQQPQQQMFGQQQQPQQQMFGQPQQQMFAQPQQQMFGQQQQQPQQQMFGQQQQQPQQQMFAQQPSQQQQMFGQQQQQQPQMFAQQQQQQQPLFPPQQKQDPFGGLF